MRRPLAMLVAGATLALALAGCGSSAPRAADAKAGYTFSLSAGTLTVARAPRSSGHKGEQASVACEQDYAQLLAKASTNPASSPDVATGKLKLPPAGRALEVKLSRALKAPDACQLDAQDATAIAFFSKAAHAAYERQLRKDNVVAQDQAAQVTLNAAYDALAGAQNPAVFHSAENARAAVLGTVHGLKLTLVQRIWQVKGIDTLYIVDDQKPGVVHFAERSQTGQLWQFTADTQHVLRAW